MAFMKAILDNGTPTGQNDALSSEDESNHVRLSLSKNEDSDAAKSDKDDKDDDDDDNHEAEEEKKSHKSSTEEPDYSSFSDSDAEVNEGTIRRQRHESESHSSTHSNEEKHRVRRKPPTGNRHQPWHNAEPQSHQDMLQEKFSELRNLLTESGGNQVDKHLLKKTKALMKQYQVAQSGLIPGPGFKGHKSPRSPRSENRAMQWARSSNAWHEQDTVAQYTNTSPPVAHTPTGEEYILIDGTGDEVKTRRVKFSDVETESIPDGHPALDLLGSLGLPFSIAPTPPRPTSGWNRPSRPRRKAASAERPKETKDKKPKRKSVTRSPSAESRSRSRSSSSRSRSRSESTSKREAENEKAKKTDHHLKDTENDKLQEWLKKKDKELKARKKEERKRKKEKRDQKRRETDERQKLKEKSEEAVKMWFVKKEEEQRLLQRRERVRQPLKKNEFSYSLELITLAKSPEGDGNDHHASNPEISRRDPSSAQSASSENTQKMAPRLRGKSAKVRSTSPNKASMEEAKKRKSYKLWLEEKRKSDKVEKEKGQKSKQNITDAPSEEVNPDTLAENVEQDKDYEHTKPDMDDEELLTDVGQRRDVNMNIKRKDSDSFDPYDKPKDYTLDYETRRNLMQYSDSLEKEEVESPTNLESSQPSFRLPSPPLISHSPVPMREKPHEGHPIGADVGDPAVENPHDGITPHPPPPDIPRTSAYRRVKREQASWDEFSDNVWTQVNEEAEGNLTENQGEAPSIADAANEQAEPKESDSRNDEGFGQDEDTGDKPSEGYEFSSPGTEPGNEDNGEKLSSDVNDDSANAPDGVDVDGDVDVEQEPPPLVADEDKHPIQDGGTSHDDNTHLNTQITPEADSAFIGEDSQIPMSDALHLNPIKEESELEAAIIDDNNPRVLDDDANDNMGDKQEGTSQSCDISENVVGKSSTTFLTAGDE